MLRPQSQTFPSITPSQGGDFWSRMEVSLSKPNPDDKPEPRTAIALTDDNHLIFFVVDGRKKRHSRGLTYPELADTFSEIGCSLRLEPWMEVDRVH